MLAADTKNLYSHRKIDYGLVFMIHYLLIDRPLLKLLFSKALFFIPLGRALEHFPPPISHVTLLGSLDRKGKTFPKTIINYFVLYITNLRKCMVLAYQILPLHFSTVLKLRCLQSVVYARGRWVVKERGESGKSQVWKQTVSHAFQQCLSSLQTPEI